MLTFVSDAGATRARYTTNIVSGGGRGRGGWCAVSGARHSNTNVTPALQAQPQ